jgi:hypothetical protein
MIEATIKTPGSKHVKDQLVRNNPFIKELFVIGKLMSCWLTILMEFKQNALIKTVYDELIPSEHYTLTFTMYESGKTAK